MDVDQPNTGMDLDVDRLIVTVDLYTVGQNISMDGKRHHVM